MLAGNLCFLFFELSTPLITTVLSVSSFSSVDVLGTSLLSEELLTNIFSYSIGLCFCCYDQYQEKMI